MTSHDLAVRTASGTWTAAERRRLAGIIGTIVLLHVLGIALFLAHSGDPAIAGKLAGAGVAAYVLGMRHAFDADHIAAIDDTTRLMLLRGRRPVGVGFFFAMGHSTVVVVLALVVALAAGRLQESDLDSVRETGGMIALLVAIAFLLLVATLNGVVLRSLVRLWRQVRGGQIAERQVEEVLLDRGLLNRLLGGRMRGLIRSSWHMFPVGLLMGLGMETASEVTLLALAGTAGGHDVPLLAVLSLPILFAAGMSTFDTVDSLLMTRAYSWAYRNPVRTLFYNTTTTAITVAIAVFVCAVYLSGFLADHAGLTWLAGFGDLAEQFEYVGYGIAAVFVLVWGGALLWWKLGRFDDRYRPVPAREAAKETA
ncbi:nickel/cobalt efflux system [Longimycelium tulufanense]|uniref:Nickel/cobalt efflux system n=1 Tax=Longimycelium tulufanense TaxID=907463 RepID=A0A8J3FSR5_9PSEU|nr:HoxN/HupN/NixA family nickel/cobalt transporter [Longimycelium tulufanense]GGM38827.1 nickel/cobalt efflux system [Longimycelium tulufanense]